jgi:hypothetical protein
MMTTNTISGKRSDEEHLVLGRALMDQGFRDLFRHDAGQACSRLQVSISSEACARIRQYLDKIDSLDAVARDALSTKLRMLERWKQQ